MFQFFWIRNASVWSALIYIIIGIILTLFPGISGIIFVRTLAVISLIFAVLNIYRYVKQKNDVMQSGGRMFSAILFLIFFAVCFMNPEVVLSILPVLLGILLIIDGTGKLPIAIEAFKMRNNTAMPVLPLILSAIIPLIFGIIIVINPFTVSSMVIMIFGISLLADGISDLVTAIMTKKNHSDDQ